jgi:flagellar hook-associated protein 2
MSTNVGLVSGLDTKSLISQLMQVEANPRSLLKNKLVATNADGAGYRAVNLRFDSLRSAAAALATDATWTATRATSSSASVTAAAGAAASAGTLTFTVDRLVSTHAVRSDVRTAPPGKTAAADTDFGATSISVKVGSTTTTIALDTDTSGAVSMTEAAEAINARKELGLTASVVRVAEGSYRMQLTTGTTGLAGRFEVTSGSPAFADLTTGDDATLTVGSGAGAYTVTSPTNTFAGLLPETTLTVSKAGETATVSIARDADATAARVQALVDAANSALQVVTDYSAKDSTTATLKGDSTLRTLAGRVLDVVSSGVGGKSAATIGIQLTKDGKLGFDKAAFTAALATDPVATRKFLTETSGTGASAKPVGLAAHIEELARGASDATTGTLTLLAKSSDSTAKDLSSRIADWDTRLAIREDALTRQFTAMEKALGALSNRSNWLAGQLAGLPSWSRS